MSKIKNNKKIKLIVATGSIIATFVAIIVLIITYKSNSNVNYMQLQENEAQKTSQTLSDTLSQEQNNNTLFSFDIDPPFFHTNALDDISVFIAGENKDLPYGTYKVIHNVAELKDFMNETTLDFNKKELYQFTRLEDSNFRRFVAIAYLDTYEDESYDREASNIELRENTITLRFQKNLESEENTGSGYWLYFVFIDKVAIDNEDITQYPLTIEMVD